MNDAKKRYDFILLFDVTNGNPNGDPDAGNAPRIDPETGHGLVSDVCLKRKIRNYITLAKRDSAGSPLPGYDIYVKEKAILNQQHARAYKHHGLEPAKNPDNQTLEEKLTKWMCQTFFDIRMFGAVMTTEINCGQVRGPVQFAFASSVDPVVSLEQTITRMAVTTEAESKKQEGGNRTMGRKEIIPYGLYVAHGFYSPYLAEKTNFSDADLSLLWEAVEKMFEVDRSAARGEMAKEKLIVFQHENPLGNASAHQLFNRLTVTRRDQSHPARTYSDYQVTLDNQDLPVGITVYEV